jgi:hypothetical protein
MAVPRFRVTERQVLMALLVASFVVFGGAFVLSGFRQRGEPRERTSQPRVHWMPAHDATPTAPTAYLLAEYFDPSLMSLPSAEGFSRRMWQRSAAAPTQIFDPPSELALLDPQVTNELGTLLPKQPLAESVQSSVEKLPATAQDTPTNEPFAATAATQSTLRVEGELEQRNILEIPSLPVPAVDAGLRPTRVRVAVAADGRVRYATLDRSCGNEAVDGQALELARRLIFERTSSADPLSLTWGMLKFSWAVTASK